MIGTRLGPYEIVAPLGAGGMGEVWRARDERLGRDVAIKVLPAEVAADPDRVARFEREARVLAALSHPNILGIFDFGKEKLSLRGAEGPEAIPSQEITYAVTELLEGETLRERLRRERLPWRKAVEIAAAMADGLAAAHGKGIIHRDLKPDNVFVTEDGRVKILDFGLARLAASPLVEAQTFTSPPPGTLAGAVLGTVGFMAPEQVRGEPADARSDIFALGCVLYEMLSGERAFKRDTAAETMTAILREPAPEVSTSGVEATPELNRVLGRCLEKQPAQRFQSTADLAFALRSLATDSAVATMPVADSTRDAGEALSIVVLPFENLSPDPDNAFFADGLTEEVIADLSKVRGLRVISRTSAMQFKGTPKGIPEIARELKVGHVLEGSVRRAGNSLRITAQLIEAATDAHLWAEKYTGTLDDVFDLQEKLSRRIVEALKGRLTPDDAGRLAVHATTDPRVFEVWMRARQDCWRMNQEGIERAIRLTEQALETFGEHALLHAANGYFHYFAYDFGISHCEETLNRGEASADRALELTPDLSLALFAKGLTKYKRGDMPGFVRYLKRALESERNSDTLLYLAFTSADAGRMDEARRYSDEALERDPLTWTTSFSRAFVDFLDGQFDAALPRFRKWTASDATNPGFSMWWLGQALALAGKEDEAVAAFERGARSEPALFSEMCELGARAFRGNRREALEWFESAKNLQDGAIADEIYPAFVSTCFARLGEMNLALRWLEQAIRWGFTNHRFHSEHNRFLAPLRGDSRFEALMKLAQEKAHESEPG